MKREISILAVVLATSLQALAQSSSQPPLSLDSPGVTPTLPRVCDSWLTCKIEFVQRFITGQRPAAACARAMLIEMGCEGASKRALSALTSAAPPLP